VHVLPVILSLLVSLVSQPLRVIAAEGRRDPDFVPASERRAKQESQGPEVIARQTKAESEALYQFMVAEDRAGPNGAEAGSTRRSPQPR